MKMNALSKLMLSATVIITLACSFACSETISHTESDKPNWFGGRTKTETTVKKNADGTVSTDSSKQVTK